MPGRVLPQRCAPFQRIGPHGSCEVRDRKSEQGLPPITVVGAAKSLTPPSGHFVSSPRDERVSIHGGHQQQFDGQSLVLDEAVLLYQGLAGSGRTTFRQKATPISTSTKHLGRTDDCFDPPVPLNGDRALSRHIEQLAEILLGMAGRHVAHAANLAFLSILDKTIEQGAVCSHLVGALHWRFASFAVSTLGGLRTHDSAPAATDPSRQRPPEGGL